MLKYVIRNVDHEQYLLSENDWAPFICDAVNSATESITFAAYSISSRWHKSTPDAHNLWVALVNAPLRKVRCRCIIAEHKKNSPTFRFNRRAIWLLDKNGWNVSLIKPSKLLHAKVITIDSKLVILGSHNFTQTASSSNIDLSIAIYGKQPSNVILEWITNIRTKYGSRYKSVATSK
jgi:phosphatidylserine/phosphatidylglycerophosphate/cardiolipin synthase-like enzyme